MVLRKLNRGLWLILLLSCSQVEKSKEREIFIPLDDNILPRTDFISLDIERNRLLIKNKLTNSIEVFDFSSKKRLSTIYLPGGLSYSEIQSAIYINADSILVLFKNDPTLYLSDEYGNVYNYWPLIDSVFTHFSITTNPPIIYNDKLYISVIPNLDKLKKHYRRKKLAVEYVMTLTSHESHEILLSIPKKDTMLVGLRHTMSTRTFANGSLNYLWGSGGDVLRLHLDNENQEIITPDLDPILLTPFEDAYNNNRSQMSYYYAHQLYDHITYDKYKKQYYIHLLHAGEQYIHKYQRDFTVIILDTAFEFVDKKVISGNKYVFDQEFVTDDGLFLSLNNPFNKKISSDTLYFEKIIF